MKKTICIILIAAFVALLGTSTYFIIDHFQEEKEQAQMYGSLAQIVEKPETEPTEPIQYSEDAAILPELTELYRQNSDLVGWVRVEDTNINYPVMQTVDNPNFYLKHGFDKGYTDYGCPYVQEDCDVQAPSDNIVIYGHNMKNGSMFGTLSHYQDQALWEASPYFYLYVPGKVLKYQIFSCYAGYVGSEAYTYAFPEEADFQAFLKQIRSYAGYDTGVEVVETDRVVTLSTCVSSRRDYRYIVHGKLTEEIAN